MTGLLLDYPIKSGNDEFVTGLSDQSDVMKYKNYYGSVHYSDEDKILYGKLEGIRDLVSYEGKDVLTLRESFEEAVEDYLATCGEEGRTPATPLFLLQP